MTHTGLSLWVYLSTTPLLWLTVTLLAWLVAEVIAERCKRHPLANPVLIAILIVSALLLATGTPYGVYFEGAQFVHFLLGPATVAIAIPLYRNGPVILKNLPAMAAALLAGSVVAVLSALGLGYALGLPPGVLVALAPKSVTAGVAMGISEGLGGQPALTAVLVIATGLTGALLITPLMSALRITSLPAQGFAAGLASHGIGTARAFAISPVAGVFAGIAMALNALVTALIVPVLVRALAVAP